MGAHCHVSGEAKVAEFGVGLVVQEDVLRFEITMQDAVGMKVVESRN